MSTGPSSEAALLSRGSNATQGRYRPPRRGDSGSIRRDNTVRGALKHCVLDSERMFDYDEP